MSAFTGSQHRGALKQRREQKKLEAEERNARTPDEKRRKNRDKTT